MKEIIAGAFKAPHTHAKDIENVNFIINEVCDAFQVHPQALVTRRRTAEVREPRQWCMHFVHKYFSDKLSLARVGGIWGRDHATVIHANKVMKDRCDTEREFKRKYNQVDRVIKQRLKLDIDSAEAFARQTSYYLSREDLFQFYLQCNNVDKSSFSTELENLYNTMSFNEVSLIK